MKIKVIVLDIDGTLLNSEKKISDLTKNALIQAQKNGVKLILASGRPTVGMVHLTKELEMDKHHGLIVSFNGSQVVDCETHQIIFNQTMPINECQRLLEHLKKFDVIPMITRDDIMYVHDVYKCFINLPNNPNFNVIEYESRGGSYKLCEVDDLALFADFPQNKILVAGSPEYLKENYRMMSEPFTNTLNSMFTASIYYEFTAMGIDKAHALDTVLRPLGIQRDEVISFGDGHNDLSIINYAGIGIAMGNAVEDLKQAANDITLTNDEDGIYYSLKKYGLE
jgi:hypothetical protein